MSRIDDLIRDLCPDGVEFRPVGEFSELTRGHGMPKSTFRNSGVNCIHYGHIYTRYGVSTSHTVTCVDPDYATTLTTVNPGDLVIANTSENLEDVGTAVAWSGIEKAVTGGHATVIKSNQNSKYLSYYFRTPSFLNEKRKYSFGTKVVELSTKNLARIPIPLPPLEVQNEIVRTLDRFTRLESELESELESRQHQYDYYLNKILGFAGESEVPWRTLSELGSFYRGKRFVKSNYVDQGIPCIHYGEIYTRYGVSTSSVVSNLDKSLRSKLRFAQPGDVVLVDVGEVVDDVGRSVAWIGDEPVAIHDHSYAFRSALNPTFVSYVMRTDWFRRQKAKHIARTKVKTLLLDGFSKIQIPAPSPAEQDRIVDKLNQFDTLVNDLNSGLPAEIEARRQQYKYYRDRLLTFPEKK